MDEDDFFAAFTCLVRAFSRTKRIDKGHYTLILFFLNNEKSPALFTAGDTALKPFHHSFSHFFHGTFGHRNASNQI
jgi:hypothetical protein